MPKPVHKTIFLLASLLLASFGVCENAIAKDRFAGKKILHIESYHEGYEWSDGIVNGIRSVLKDTDIALNVWRMDTKRHPDEAYKQKAAQNAKALIDSYQPDLVIASDDNASKYLVAPYYKDSKLPIVFCGVNWNASGYGYPYKNATGMVEVDPMEEILRYFKRFAKGDTVAYISGKTFTDQMIADYLNKIFCNGKMKIYSAQTFEEFKKVCLQAQKEADALLLNNNQGISGWNHKEAIRFAHTEIRLPTSTTNPWMAEYTLFAMAKLPEEQGAWAARTALAILDGTPPSDIKIVYNEMAVLTVNMRIAKKLGFFFDLADLQRARIIR